MKGELLKVKCLIYSKNGLINEGSKCFLNTLRWERYYLSPFSVWKIVVLRCLETKSELLSA